MPGTLVAPSLVLGATDSRKFESIADDVYRFLPYVIGPDDTSRIHGTDERISVESYRNCVRFYFQLLTNQSAAGQSSWTDGGLPELSIYRKKGVLAIYCYCFRPCASF